ncbi:hypothetical protein COCNU_11G000620 [Cocos nucifera]|uniref:Uncharacterized protein n=1 Tax=Cocos nucifera TaxID=13894 RepID=A0A8K0IND0_COCNU|nr:hypothetical protein COCNU_11G000620 [Cocos nucifera]
MKSNFEPDPITFHPLFDSISEEPRFDESSLEKDCLLLFHHHVCQTLEPELYRKSGAKPPLEKPEERREDEEQLGSKESWRRRRPSVALAEEEEVLLDEHHHINLLRSASNATSQVAIVGSHVCPIESLGYELFENDFFKQDRRSRDRAHIIRYVTLKWSLCFLFRALAGAIVFFNNLAGVKFVVTSNLMLAKK